MVYKHPPNIIYILADDLGYGDLSCYGQQRFNTPNIDALASHGIRFTQHYSGSTVCAPSRSTLMTGQHTGHTPIRGNKSIAPEGQHPIADEVLTLAEVLRAKGYATGAFGKWGLGYPGSTGDPIKQGFDTFYGYNCQFIAHNYYPYHLWHNEEKIMLQQNEADKEGVYAPELIHEKALAFIEENKDQPFFAYIPSIVPHAELKAPERYMAKYRGKLQPEKSYKGCDPGCKRYKIGGYGSQPEVHAAFAAMIHVLDEQVGEIVAKVKALGIAENTLIFFTSDNGPHLEGGADPNYFDSNGIYRGYKRDLYEGGIRVPMIAHWEGTITPGQTTDHVSAFWDVLPTVVELAGAKVPEQVDGISFLPALLGKEQPKHKHLYWEFQTQYRKPAQAVLMGGRWKAIRKVKDQNFTPMEIYDLESDPGERHNLAAIRPELVKKALAIIERERIDSPVPEWNFDIGNN
ncbi:arylsulfatase [Muricauda sp. SCSIO 64092]|uniref:arylsulfatase n=1 Tax=Allomuricauda sp. SCSIO 64092 TaxID=2908842 RepID=UPI001FF5F4A3|nr:arylsulfatase [Muricauda sp. SCSIO 64092]UOY08046.1 arylsulfatase [Muricauda sp. SCSIO 64092]